MRNRLIVRAAMAALGLVINICLFRAGDAILVKGSRASGMESVAESLERTLDAPGGADVDR